MKSQDLGATWSGLSEEMLAEVVAWRAKHPKATMREIEAEIDQRLSALRAQMISDAANASVSATWEAPEGVMCPECGAKLVKKGKERILLTREGRKLELV